MVKLEGKLRLLVLKLMPASLYHMPSNTFLKKSSLEDTLLLIRKEGREGWEDREETEGGREGGRGGETERDRERCETNIDPLPPVHAPTWNQTCSLDIWPDWGLNTRSFGIWDNTPIN